MFVLFKLCQAKFGVSDLFLSKLMEKPIAGGRGGRGGGGTRVNSVRARIF